MSLKMLFKARNGVCQKKTTQTISIAISAYNTWDFLTTFIQQPYIRKACSIDDHDRGVLYLSGGPVPQGL